MFDRLRRLWSLSAGSPPPVAPSPAAETVPTSMRISSVAVAEARAAGRSVTTPWGPLPQPAPGVLARGMALDQLPVVQSILPLHAWAQSSAYGEGLGFMGFSYLAELSQRPEYRQIIETYARESTRKWIKVRGADDKRVSDLTAALAKWKVQDVFRELATLDGMFGRGHLYIDTGRPNDDGKALLVRKETLGKGRLKKLTVVEPMWTYPARYDASNPLAPTFYAPEIWHVNGRAVHSTRLLTVVGRELPDILKPSYAFGGLSLSQMVKPYVDNWLRTRQSVSDLIHAFSTMVLSTNMASVVSGLAGSMNGLISRIQAFNIFRDNHGTMAIDKDTETLQNIAVPLGTLDKLQAQSQEQMASVSRIPLVILLGVTPSGLNASSDGEIRSFYSTIKAYQEHTFRDPLRTVIDVIQLSEFGNIDESITFEFEPLWEMDEKDKAEVRKTNADTDVAYVNAGVVSNEETRERLSNDETSLYQGVDLSGPPPEPEDDDDDAPGGANDSWNETDHPRDVLGRFGSGDGDSYFTDQAHAEAQSKVGSQIVHMSPADFIALAWEGHEPDSETTVETVLNETGKFDEIPYLRFVFKDGEAARVTNHDGRHRARALHARGVTSIPVLLRGSSLNKGGKGDWSKTVRELQGERKNGTRLLLPDA